MKLIKYKFKEYSASELSDWSHSFKGYIDTKNGEIIDLAVEHGFINKTGAWFTDAEDSSLRWQGRANAKLYIEEHSEYKDKLETLIRKRLKGEENITSFTEKNIKNVIDE